MLPATSPSGIQGYDCWWVVTGTAGRNPSLAGGRWEHQSIQHPQSTVTHQPSSLWLLVGERGTNRWSQWLSGQHFWPSQLAYLCPSPPERIVSPWARSHSYMRDGHYTVRTRKPGQGSGTRKTAANALPCPLLEVQFPIKSVCGHNGGNTPGFCLTEAPFCASSACEQLLGFTQKAVLRTSC